MDACAILPWSSKEVPTELGEQKQAWSKKTAQG